MLICVVKVSQSLPQGLALQLSFLQPLGNLRVVWTGRCIGWGSRSTTVLNLLDKAFVLFVEHADVSLESIGLTLHIAVDLGPLILLLGGHLILLTHE